MLYYLIIFLSLFSGKSPVAQQEFFSGKLIYQTLTNRDTITSIVYVLGDSIRVDFGFKTLPYSHGLYFLGQEKGYIFSTRENRFMEDEIIFAKDRNNYRTYNIAPCSFDAQSDCLHYEFGMLSMSEIQKTEIGDLQLSDSIRIPCIKNHVMDAYALNGAGFCTLKGTVKIYVDSKIIEKRIRLVSIEKETPEKTLFSMK